jgi:hypothetical protein
VILLITGFVNILDGTDKFGGKTKEEFILEVQERYHKLIRTPFEHRPIEDFSLFVNFLGSRRGCSPEDTWTKSA